MIKPILLGLCPLLIAATPRFETQRAESSASHALLGQSAGVVEASASQIAGRAEEAVPPNPRFGLTELSLMAGALGALWTMSRAGHHRRRRSLGYTPVASSRSRRRNTGSGRGTGTPPPRHRIRRFDHDRFYLHVVRDL